YTAVLVASSLAVALAPNFPVFLVGRSLVGVSIGGFWSLSTAILARLASGRDEEGSAPSDQPAKKTAERRGKDEGECGATLK
ncbi:hypothetical protein ACC791_37410, partial [Rhizobium ruizarguesonis]